jgi:purine-binding chemotaxis protein CheW
VVRLAEGPALLLSSQRLRPGEPASPELPESSALELPSVPASAAGQLVLFATTAPTPRARPLSFGLSLAQLLEVVELPTPLPVPGAPAWVLGLTEWRGRALPVLDLALRLGLPPSVIDRRARLLVVRASPKDAVGVVVRPGVRVLSPQVRHRPCTRALTVTAGLCRGAFELAGETVVVPDLAALV